MKNITRVSMLALATVFAIQASAGETTGTVAAAADAGKAAAAVTPPSAAPQVAATTAASQAANQAATTTAAATGAKVGEQVGKAAGWMTGITAGLSTIGSYMPASKLGKAGVFLAAAAAVGTVYNYRKEIANFVKKHWGKLAIGAGAITAAVLANKYGYLTIPAFLAGKAAVATPAAATPATTPVVPAKVEVTTPVDVVKVTKENASVIDPLVKSLLNIQNYVKTTVENTLKNVDTTEINKITKTVDNIPTTV